MVFQSMTQRLFDSSLAFSSDYPLWALGAVGLVLMVAFGGLAWLETRSGNRRWVPLFLVLRLTALGIVLWLLAGPVLESKHFNTHPKHVAIMIDDSASMGIVDPSTPEAMSMRWNAALDEEGDASHRRLARVDEAAAGLLSVRIYLDKFERSVNQGASQAQLRQITRHIDSLLIEALQTLSALADQMSREDPDLVDTLQQVRADLLDSIRPKFDSLAQAVDSETIYSDPILRERLAELRGLAAAQVSRLNRLTDRFANRMVAEGNPMQGDRQGRTRLEYVESLLQGAQGEVLSRIGERAEVQYFRFDRETYPYVPASERPASTQAQATDLAAALEHVTRSTLNQGLEAFVLFTDGAHNARRDPLEIASAINNLPLFIVPVGAVEPQPDVIMHHVQAPRAVIQNDTILIEGSIDAYGFLGHTLQLELWHNDQLIETQSLKVTLDHFNYRFAFMPKGEELGQHRYLVQVVPLEGELHDDNSRAELNVDVTEAKIRVLLAEELPRWEFRYLYQLFKRDESIEYDIALFEGNVDQANELPAELPRTIEEWTRYRAVILGDLPPEHLTPMHQEMLKTYVGDRGGTLILIAGKEAMPQAYMNTPLATLVPAQPTSIRHDQGYQLFMTAEGRATPWLDLLGNAEQSAELWTQIYRHMPVYELSPVSAPKPSAHVMLGASPVGSADPANPEQAFLMWHNYGSGRVVYLAAPDTYRLRFRYGDRYHHLFWGQLLRWATARELGAGSETVRLITDKIRYSEDDVIQATLLLTSPQGTAYGGALPELMVMQDDKIVKTLPLEEDPQRPGMYQTQIENLPPESYRLLAGGKPVRDLLAAEKFDGEVSTLVLVEADQTRELSETRCNLALLEQIAEATGGAVIPPTALDKTLRQLDIAPVINEYVERRPIWARWSYLWIFVGCLTLEWTLRKLRGMA